MTTTTCNRVDTQLDMQVHPTTERLVEGICSNLCRAQSDVHGNVWPAGPTYFLLWTIIGAFIFLSLFVVVLLGPSRAPEISRLWNHLHFPPGLCLHFSPVMQLPLGLSFGSDLPHNQKSLS